MKSSMPILINQQLNAVDMKSLVLAPPRLRDEFIHGDVVREEPAPLSPDGSLRPGVLYESTDGSAVRFYLPAYALRRVAGEYTTRLKLRDPQTEPEGPLAWLTIELVADVPPLPPVDPLALVAPFTLREIPHDTRLRLGYQVASADAAGQLTVDAPRTTLWIDLEPLNRIDAVVAVSRTPVTTQERYDRLFQIMTDAQYNTLLEIQCRATVGQRTWNQWLVGDLVAQRAELKHARVREVEPEFARAIRDSATLLLSQQVLDPVVQPVVEEPPIADTLPATPLVDVSTLISLIDVTPVLPAQPLFTLSTFNSSILSGLSVIGRTSDVGLESLGETGAPQPAARLERLPLDDFMPSTMTTLNPDIQLHILDTRPDLADQLVTTYLPRRVVVDDNDQPAIVRREVVVSQAVPFLFSRESEAYMFDAPVDTGTTLVLFRTDITIGDATVTFYQDSLVREQVYYEPQEFRLARPSEAPYLPRLLFAFNNVQEVTDEGAADGATGIDYKVRCSYNVKPTIDPAFLLQARLVYDPQTRFTALTPSAAGLLLALPQAGGELGTAEPATDVLISFDDGIVGDVELTPVQFEQLIAAFQSPLGVGMQGHVDATLIDASQVQIGVEVSLRKNAGRFFAVASPVAEGDGVYSVTLRNRLESPVLIESLSPVALGQRAAANPLDLPPAEPVAPNAEVSLRYQVTPPEFIPLRIEPALSVAILPDLPVLLSRLMVNEGYHSDTFTITVSLDPAFLIAPLTGLRVTFDSGPSVNLSADNPSAAVTLRMPLLPRLLNSPAALEYRYRVTNLTAAGNDVASEWVTWTGDLAVVPAGVA